MWVRPLLDSDAQCGAKAHGLSRLIAAGLPVPDGFVIDARAFRFVVGETPNRDEIGHALEHAAERISLEEAVPAHLVADVAARASALGPLAVRSSASIEDTQTGSAAGVFASVTNVIDPWPAIRAVWTSALAPLATAYGRGQPIAMGVIIQRFIPGERITVYTRKPGAPDGPYALVQRGEHVHEVARDHADSIVTLALRAEFTIRATRGADVELVEDRDGKLWIVQARPIIHPPPPSRIAPPPALLAALVADGRTWTWDVTHNPDPLSPAQQGLVERVERAGIAPWSMRVCAGFLYSTPSHESPAAIVNDRNDLDVKARAIESEFARILDVEEPSLALAIERYLELYEIWACEMVPLIAAARRGLSAQHLVGARPSSVESTLRAAARGDITDDEAIARLAPLSTTWDVAVPTFGERAHVIREAIVRVREIPHDESSLIGNELARAAADLAERDDVWFAKAQLMVRQALLRRATALGLDPEDICWLSLDDLVAGIVLVPDEARRLASAAKAAAARSAKWAMPLVIGGDQEDARPSLHGFGSDARISGRVVRFESLASAIAVSRGDIIVTRAITPALAVFVVGCAAIISESGGPLDHGAALARELGIPFVVGCKDAWSLLRDGMIVTIDHDRVTSGSGAH